jgi:hypothetical protein
MAAMRGQAALEAMRRSGVVPAWVWIDTDHWRSDVPETWQVYAPQHAHLQSTKPDRAALRCVVGLPVQIDGEDRERVNAMRDACIAAGAKRVIASLYERRDDVPDYERYQVIEVSDTDGRQTWRR